MKKSARFAGSALVLIGLLLTMTGVTYAGLKATAVVYAWDQAAGKFQNSNVIINFDGSWVSFLHELNFDKNIYPTDYPDHLVPEACPGGGTTRWAGEMEYGLYHTDDAPLGAPGFVRSRNWQLVSCDRDGDGDFDNADLSLPPQTAVTPYVGGTFDILSIDVTTDCTTGNCLNEIVTTFFVNIDSDCDGTPNADLPPEGLCFYAEAQTPVTSDPFWSGPLQARISAGGGDKTVNFDPQPVPTAITLLAFTATPLRDSIALEWVTASEIDSVGFNLYRGDLPDRQDIQLNDVLISSQDPGSGGEAPTLSWTPRWKRGMSTITGWRMSASTATSCTDQSRRSSSTGSIFPRCSEQQVDCHHRHLLSYSQLSSLPAKGERWGGESGFTALGTPISPFSGRGRYSGDSPEWLPQ